MDSQFGLHAIGAPGSLDYRLFIQQDGKLISSFHDIPLFSDEGRGVYNMIVEIPRWTNAKMEISRDEPLNPILQDIKDGQLRYVHNVFPHKGYIWNYGALPQTWENPNHVHPDTGAKGDNDPIDALEIGEAVGHCGQVKQVKALGVMGLLDDGETDWKIVVIDVNDPLASQLNDIADVEKHLPGLLDATRDWFRFYKVPAGKRENILALNGEFRDKAYATNIIAECADSWGRLIHGKVDKGQISIVNLTVQGSPGHVAEADAQMLLPKDATSRCNESGHSDKWHYIKEANRYTSINYVAVMSETHDKESPATPRGYKRKRVAKACYTCRAMKSKCDGKQPECSRCVGYGYQCAYSAAGPCHVQGYNELRKVIDEYHRLAETLQRQRPDESAAKSPSREPSVTASAAAELSLIRARANCALDSISASLVAPHAPDTPESSATSTQNALRCAEDAQSPPEPLAAAHGSRSAERYLGEASDVQFFNFVKRTLQSASPLADEGELDSYEQDERLLAAAASQRLVKLPSQAQIERWTGVYFATIHLAYPFIPQVEFVAHYKALGKERPKATVANALLYVLCAIGIYYSSFPSNHEEAENLHELFFLRSQSLAASAGPDQHTLDYIKLLLAQCFYYLAVCRIDNCWTVLGKAVRIAQSIGLHAEPRSPSAEAQRSLQTEKRRRVWYSIYVLDRLLSLQLGRPPAIHDDDCCVPLPCRVADANIDWQGSCEIPIASGDDRYDETVEASVGDYFLAVISFSRIVGFVLRSLYSPAASRSVVSNLASTQRLDQQLTQWKMKLPRTLRFDLGHVFDQTVAYKRQRNMLAVKYHHLRALIHRPYLCYPLLRSMDGGLSAPAAAWPDITVCEKICIAEAHATARLLHSISSEASLVHDFPWWQMISCLVCAGSILVVASIFSQQTDNEVDGVDAEALSDDAETCLRVFEALSSNSTAASIARNMLEKLKQCGATWRTTPPAGIFTPLCTASAISTTSSEPQTLGSASPHLPRFAADEANTLDMVPIKSSWPAEIVDSMSWSAQFFQAAYHG